MPPPPEVVVLDDAGHVVAPPWLVWRRLADIAAWPTWWPGMLVDTLAAPGFDPAGPDGFVLDVVVPGRRARLLHRSMFTPRLRVAAHAIRWRHEHSLHMVLAGDVIGDVEWWLEATATGTLVHHVATLSPGTRTAGPTRWRAVVRRGLWGLADALGTEVRTAVAMPD